MMKDSIIMSALCRWLMATAALAFAISVDAKVSFVYQGQTKYTDRHCLLVDDSRRGNEADFLFASVSDALAFADKHYDSKDSLWTEIFICPSVYWMDNPDDEAIRRPKPGDKTPYAMEVKASRLRLIGLCDNPEDVVLACNRGQTQGADGNFTMFHFLGNHIEAANITFGNYCNVDLVYPRDSSKNRKKRKNAIVQAQIAICEGYDYHIDNCRFISRLNLCPFISDTSTVFTKCYFECTDDALCGSGVYDQCRFTFFSGKPFYTTNHKTGAVFRHCDIHSKTSGTQYLTKVSGPVAMEYCRWTSDDPQLKIEWSKRPDPRHLCTMTGCTLNGKPLNVPTPTDPLPVVLPPFAVQVQTAIVPGGWTLDCHKPTDTMDYDWQADNTRPAWGYAEGADGAEGSWGMVQLQKGARMMFTPADESAAVGNQECRVTIDPCKTAGQGFGSATGQYLDICIKFDTRSLTGYGIRFIRTPEYDHAVEIYLVEYSNGIITKISSPERCNIFKRGCRVSLSAQGGTFTAKVSNTNYPDIVHTLTATMPHPNPYGGFHLQHTGSTGASATVIKSIILK